MQRNTFTLQQVDPALGKPGSFSSFFKKLSALVLVLAGLGASQQAWGQAASVDDDAITLTVQPTGKASQSGQNYAGAQNNSPYDSYTQLGQSSNNAVQVPQLGTFDLNGNSAITLTDAKMDGTVTTSATTVTATRLQYRLYLMGTADAMKPSYTNLTLTSNQTTVTSTISTFTGNSSGNSIDLLSGLTSGGTYVLDVRFQVDIKKGSTTKTVSDLSGGDYYYANFYVTPPPTTPAGGTTTWQGIPRGTSPGGTPMALPADTDWNNTANWTNGVPTRFSNAVIPPKSTGSNIVYPILNDPKANYKVKNLTLQGNSNSSAGQLSVNAATLRVYGDINQPAGGLLGNLTNNAGVTDSTQNSTLVLAGINQVITGNLLMSDIIIAGAGTKSIINQLIVTNILAFEPSSATNGVIVQSAAQDNSSGSVMTVFDTTGNSYIQLLAQSVISTVAGQAETNVSYIKGVSRTDRQVVAGVQNTFGNIGLDITANHSPGNIVVYRVVGDALTGPVSSTAVPIKRQYRVVGDNDSNNSGFAGSRFDAVFHYLDSADELNGIQESNLTMFRTVTNGAPYQALGGVLDQAANTVTRLAINSLSDFKLTLGDKTNPLPVSLAAFAAVRSGDKTLLTWTTATEENNKGFNVQVSIDGVKFRTLAFVESKVTNSIQAQYYTYTDAEAGKTGVRYYRLEQVDVSGTMSYSPVRAVNFSGAAAISLSLSASPNPFTNELALSFDGLNAPDGPVHVKIVDMTGRTVRDLNLTMTGASIALGDLSALQSGLYLAKVTLADGTTKTVRVQHQ